MLVVFSGLPGTGKTTIARAVAERLDAVYLRVDSIEQALREQGVRVEGEGYRVGYAVAEDNLRLGRTVIADCVNPWPLTRAEWRAVAERAGVRALDIEVICSDAEEHRRRVERRQADIRGHVLPTWQDVLDRDYRLWDTSHLQIDSARLSVERAVEVVCAAVREAH